MARDEIHKGDVGTILRATVKDGDNAVNVSTASVKKFKFKKPNGDFSAVDAAFFTDGSDGILQYTSLAATFDQTGSWSVQAYVEFASEAKNHSDRYEFTVYGNNESGGS